MSAALSRARRRATYVACRLLSRERFRFAGARIAVHPGVFNPTMFRSSLLFARAALAAAPERGADALDLGCGCGLLAVALSRRGHRVTAIDRSILAVANTSSNARASGVEVRAIASDWDSALAPGATFDYVVCNPPFSPEPPPAFAGAVFAGGALEALAPALAAVSRRLRPGGRALLLSSERTGRDAYLALLAGAGLSVARHASHTRWFETFHLDLVAP